MKKRNKKYNPKQIVKQKVHKFQMFWEVNEAKRIIEMHHLLNGVDPQESTHTPLEVWMKAHKGDLSLALKTQTIPAEQSFHIVSRVHAVNKETGESVDVEFQLATPEPMHLWQFLGDEEADVYVEDGGFKKKWLGFNHELERYLESIEGDFEIVTNHCCLTCFSTFKSFRHELEFKSVKLVNPELGLGGGGVNKPLIRYHGGKFRLADWVISHFPNHTCYTEVFGGAAGVLLQKPRAYAEVYNDLDGDVVNLFKVLRNKEKCGQLIEQLVLTPYAREEFDLAWEHTDDDIERARRIIIRAQMGFGSAGATKGRTGFRIDTKRQYGTAQSLFASYPDHLTFVCERLSGVLIENRPAIQVLQDHDADTTLHYVDPPYVHETRYGGAKTGSYYKHEMTDSDHAQLLEKLLELEGMVILSGYPNDLYNEKLKGWHRVETAARISAGRGTALRTECLWINPQAQNKTDLFGGAA